ncbi:MAG: HEPN domain-containing protein [Deltaproteobacteria bacterium]|nr:HEPN domain-containing protein [Deltaproteobacteria bacterium]
MSGRPEIIAEVRRWVGKAENDFRNACFVLTMKENCPFDTVCFHSQQCAEKYIKSLLVFQELDFPRTHDLVLLFNLLKLDPSSGLRVIDVQPLNRYSIEARYPGDWEPIDETEARAALEVARTVRNTIRRFLQLDMSP